MNRNKLLKYQLLFFFGGLYIASIGKIFLIESGFGVDPWMVFHMGISNYTPLTVGQATQVVGAVMLLIGWILKIKPSIGTVLNMYFFGLFIDLNIGLNSALNLVKTNGSLIASILYFLIGIIASGIGFGLYINGEMGAGPRDSFMLGISNVTEKKPGTIRTVMESIAALIGWFLGGPLGIGTLAYALSVGTVMQWTLDHIKLPQTRETPSTRPS